MLLIFDERRVADHDDDGDDDDAAEMHRQTWLCVSSRCSNHSLALPSSHAPSAAFN